MPEMPQQYRIVADTSANLFTVRLMPGQRIALQARPTGSIWPLRLRRGFGRLAVPDVVFAGGLQPKLSRGKALGA